MAFIADIQPPSTPDPSSWWFIFYQNRLLVSTTENQTSVPFLHHLTISNLEIKDTHYLGTWKNTLCYAGEWKENQVLPEGMEWKSLRELFNLLEENWYALAGYASQIITWNQTHQYCGRCGTFTRDKTEERAKVCPSCSLTSYPRISPAVIVAITKENKILLGKSARHQRYGLIAGFLEAGETLEAAVHREVKEEVGIEVKNIRYFGSQPWAFPHTLMVGFTAEYAGGKIQPDREEITEAGWYTSKNIPHTPSRVSIAYQLIHWFTAR